MFITEGRVAYRCTGCQQVLTLSDEGWRWHRMVECKADQRPSWLRRQEVNRPKDLTGALR